MSVITAVTAQVKDKSRANIFIDGEFALGVPAIVVAELRLKPGTEISAAELNSIAVKADSEQALVKAAKLVSKSLKTEREVRNYLKEKNYLPEAVAHAVEKLKSYGYIDDSAYVRAYIRTHAKTRGEKRIAAELKNKGVAEAVIGEGLKEASKDGELNQSGACYALAVKYMKNKPYDLNTKRKLSNYLYSRGYEWTAAGEVIAKIFGEKETGEFC